MTTGNGQASIWRVTPCPNAPWRSASREPIVAISRMLAPAANPFSRLPSEDDSSDLRIRTRHRELVADVVERIRGEDVERRRIQREDSYRPLPLEADPDGVLRGACHNRPTRDALFNPGVGPPH